MGYKISLLLLALLVSVSGGSYYYISMLKKDNEILKVNQAKLEQSIQEQNESIERHLANQKRQQEQIGLLEAQRQASQREVNKLRDTFARHDLDNLALAKPDLVQKMVNRGTKKVKEDLIAITTPNEQD